MDCFLIPNQGLFSPCRSSVEICILQYFIKLFICSSYETFCYYTFCFNGIQWCWFFSRIMFRNVIIFEPKTTIFVMFWQSSIKNIPKHFHFHFSPTKFHHFLSFSSNIVDLEHQYLHLILNEKLQTLFTKTVSPSFMRGK